MIHIKTFSRHLVLFLIIISILTLFVNGAGTMTESKTVKSSDFMNGYYSPASSILSVSSSTSTQSFGEPAPSAGSSGSYGGIITESRMSLAKGQHSQHLIRFYENGQVLVKAQEGVTFNVYSIKGDTWQNSDSYKTDYTQKMKASSQNPAVMNTTPGTWIFTIDAPQEGGEYFMSAIQDAQSTSQSGQQRVTQSSDFSLQSASMREKFPLITPDLLDWNITHV